MASQWKIADAPDEFIAQMLKNIIGIEIEISKIFGKWKVSQNRSAEDQASVLAGLQREISAVGNAEKNADRNKAMVDLVLKHNHPSR